ncbi:TetR/AcrR family transcriptional regulator [Nocardia sp. NEAU-G5]|uniref:TetR/AcrR family transcriptional regulator n=1 Tax=Nocardia albiluteola TaxID=2842303 RepID=A0ABS6B550_9NOCA|nr:TetR/AcrR family transcriptional regulator [Nocardia albiluteola]MBU3065434.1 TetR/AcrR family transcriptional regulator [Nocardia albiluteola]
MSVTSEARRAQIVAAAIDTLSEFGYAGTSFAKIAARAGISSTRLISYHFEGKNDLMTAVVDHIVLNAEQYMNTRLAAAGPGRWPRLSAYITANLNYHRDRPEQLRALIEISNNVRAADGDPQRIPHHQEATLARLEAELREGQSSGEFTDFDPHVLAVTLRSAIDAAGIRYATGALTDPDAYAAELVELFRRATVATTRA